MRNISVFIGSSTEALPIARQVQYELRDDTSPKIWNQGLFRLGEATLQSLMDELNTHDFAILILSPDDLITSRDMASRSPRDNIIFELGLFMGRLGTSRTFVLYDQSVPLKMMSDLAGIIKAPYDGEWVKIDLPAAIGAACNPIRQAIRQQGSFPKRLQLIKNPKILVASMFSEEDLEFSLDKEALQNFSQKNTVMFQPNITVEGFRNLLVSQCFDIIQLTAEVERDGNVRFDERKKEVGYFKVTNSKHIPSAGFVNLLEVSKTKLLILASCNSVPLAAKLASRINMIAATDWLYVRQFFEWELVFYKLLFSGHTLSEAFSLAEHTVELPLTIFIAQDVKFVVDA